MQNDYSWILASRLRLGSQNLHSFSDFALLFPWSIIYCFASYSRARIRVPILGGFRLFEQNRYYSVFDRRSECKFFRRYKMRG